MQQKKQQKATQKATKKSAVKAILETNRCLILCYNTFLKKILPYVKKVSGNCKYYAKYSINHEYLC